MAEDACAQAGHPAVDVAARGPARTLAPEAPAALAVGRAAGRGWALDSPYLLAFGFPSIDLRKCRLFASFFPLEHEFWYQSSSDRRHSIDLPPSFSALNTVFAILVAEGVIIWKRKTLVETRVILSDPHFLQFLALGSFTPCGVGGVIFVDFGT